jgi:hypothetical protein
LQCAACGRPDVRGLSADLGDQTNESFSDPLAIAGREKLNAATKSSLIDWARANCLLDELMVMRTVGGEFRDYEVVNFQAPCRHRCVLVAGGRNFNRDQAILSACRRDHRFGTNTVCVVAIALVESRSVPDRSVNLV